MSGKDMRGNLKMSQAGVLTLAVVVIGFLVLLTGAEKIDYKHALFCEGEEVELDKCPPRHAIKVESAMFGRNKKYFCPDKANYTTMCGMKDVRHRVKAMCDARNTCTFQAATDLLGEVEGCSYVSKYVDIYYLCVQTNGVEECSKPIAEPDPNENTVVSVDVSSDEAARFSVKNHSAAFVNKQGFFILLLGVLGTVYSME